ncbi:MAG TPA: hypothetical protein DC034_14455 [Clostridium sp.]|jgi:putative cell wall-binding protein|nr:hypothetical protein [Clostridium sp.]
MSKKSTKALASAALMSLVLTTALSAGPVKAAQGKVTRTSGTTRYATAAEVAKTNWAQGSKNVVLVSGEGYADAVSASALAKKLDAPILLTASDTLSSDAKSALDTLKPENVYVIGGNASISQNIRDGLKADKYNLTELGGTTRYETNAKVADELVKLGVDPSNVMVVGGEGFSDALSVAPVAAAKGQILLLASNDQSATQPVIDFVKANNSKATVVGTKNVINDTIYDALGAASRVDGGTSRFDTNLKVLDAFKDSLKTDKVYIANASAADPDNLYADALVASAVAGKYSAPLVLVDKDGSEGTTNALAYLKNNTDSSTDVQLIGGTAVVPQSIEDDINALYNPQDQDQATAVDSVESVGLNQIKVTFNGKADSDTAEEVSNYKVNGTSLNDDKATASLQDDDKTVLITLADKQDQNDDVDVTVKKGILSEDKSNTIPEFTKTVTFEDTTAPTLDSVSVRGNNKLDIKFSEPVKAKGEDEIAALKSITDKLKINDKSLSSYEVNDDSKDTDSTKLKYSKLDDSVKAVGYYYTDEVEIYFDSDLPTGDNTLKVSDADDETLSDAAGFPIADTTQNFTVDELTTEPEITSITAEDSGKVYVNFDRPMDAKTATNKSYYAINNGTDEDSNLTDDGIKIELKKDDTQVKISGVSSLLNKNSNTIYISDKVKDAYGNKVADDTHKSFTLEEDTEKPDVSSVYALDDDTIRVKFTKDVDADYAKSTSNYTLKDSDGTDITNKIDDITIPGDNDANTGNVFDINLKSGEKLSDSKYDLTIKNIQDTASTPNVMDDKTVTFDGSSDVNAKAEVYSAGKYKIVFVFNKEMDSSTLNDTDNYEYVNGKGDTETLPSDADITVNGDNKSVTIDLSDTSLVTDGSKDVENNIDSIYATGVKDIDGNTLSIGSNGGKLTKADVGNTQVKDNSFKLYYEEGGDDLKAQVAFTNPIEDNDANRNVKNYSIKGIDDSTINPDHVKIDGDKVTLTFDKNDNDEKDLTTFINKIKENGNSTQLTISSDVTDVTGSKLGGTKEDGEQVTVQPVSVYSFDAAPRTVYKDADSPWTANMTSNDADVAVVFDTPIENSSVKPSDFTFSIGGDTVNATSVSTLDKDNKPTNTVTFKFTGSDFDKLKSYITAKGASTIKVAAKSGSVISTVKDGAESYAYYKPTSDDRSGREVTISSDTTKLSKLGTVSGTTFTPSDTTKVEDVIAIGATVKDKDGTDKTTGNFAADDIITLNGVNYTVAIK